MCIFVSATTFFTLILFVFEFMFRMVASNMILQSSNRHETCVAKRTIISFVMFAFLFKCFFSFCHVIFCLIHQ
eukprot:12263.XXX_320086_320304_1 [CDS] Oithona nana genome sequencing.